MLIDPREELWGIIRATDRLRKFDNRRSSTFRATKTTHVLWPHGDSMRSDWIPIGLQPRLIIESFVKELFCGVSSLRFCELPGLKEGSGAEPVASSRTRCILALSFHAKMVATCHSWVINSTHRWETLKRDLEHKSKCVELRLSNHHPIKLAAGTSANCNIFGSASAFSFAVKALRTEKSIPSFGTMNGCVAVADDNVVVVVVVLEGSTEQSWTVAHAVIVEVAVTLPFIETLKVVEQSVI